jgi:hypothetical protein
MADKNKFTSKWQKGGSHQHEWKSIYGKLFEGEPEAEEQPPRLRGYFVYVPHDCELPDPSQTEVGSIWACYGYREVRMCYDQWILEIHNGQKRWMLFKRNIRA